MVQKTKDETLDFDFDVAGALAYGEGDYNPLEFNPGEDDEDWMDDDGLLLPETNPPEHDVPKKVAAVYCPETAGGVKEATRKLITVNGGRRPVLMAIVDWARDGIGANELFEKVEDLEKDNKSVYDPVSYCKMLERAGALTMEMVNEGQSGETPANPDEDEFDELGEVPGDGSETGGIGYLTITESYEPVWRATPEALEVYDELSSGQECRDKLFGEDAKYAEVYLTVMNMMAEGNGDKKALAEAAETFAVTKKPLKLGPYFVDVLEATQAAAWKGGAWQLTSLGKEVLAELADYCKEHKSESAA